MAYHAKAGVETTLPKSPLVWCPTNDWSYLLFSFASWNEFHPLQRLYKPVWFFDDRVGRHRPHEGSGIQVPGGAKFRHGLLRILHADKVSQADAFAGQIT